MQWPLCGFVNGEFNSYYFCIFVCFLCVKEIVNGGDSTNSDLSSASLFLALRPNFVRETNFLLVPEGLASLSLMEGSPSVLFA